MNETGLLHVVWELTLKCNLACGHCGSRAGQARPRELTTEEALSVVRQVAEMGAEEVTLIGGEAWLRDDWAVIARAVSDAGMACGLVTGGRGVDERLARRIKAAGVRAVSVSVDGMQPAHDSQRGAGSWEQAVSAAARLHGEGVETGLNTQVNRLSFPDLDEVYELARQLGARAWQLQLTVPMGRAADRPAWLLQPWEMLEVVPKVAELKLRGAADGLLVWPGNNIGYYGPHHGTLRNGERRPEEKQSGCSAGINVLGIESDGAVKGCPSLPTSDYVGGNVRDRPIREIWESTRQLRYVRDRTKDDLWGFCKTCVHAEECMGGCTWTAHVFFGRPGNNAYCHHRALAMRDRGVRERLVQVARAPGHPFDHGRFEVVEEPVQS